MRQKLSVSFTNGYHAAFRNMDHSVRATGIRSSPLKSGKVWTMGRECHNNTFWQPANGTLSFYTMLCTAVNLHVEKFKNGPTQHQVLWPCLMGHLSRRTMVQHMQWHQPLDRMSFVVSRNFHLLPDLRQPGILSPCIDPRGRLISWTRWKWGCVVIFCQEAGHWRQECLQRRKSLTEVAQAHLKRKTAVEPLIAMAEVQGEKTRHEDGYLD